ncbi:MAG: hypothetical protein JO262_14915 [Solirubrobacterales bacterium]|nr:hypothetical protein [Solirubrobacterales bacterium]
MDIPRRDATEQYLSRMRRRLDIVCDVDLGEIVKDHHLVLRGLERAPQGAMLHYELIPGVGFSEWNERGPESFQWMVYARDDVGTTYTDYNSGAYGHSAGAAAHGVRDIGGTIPAEARILELRFEPPSANPATGVPRSVVVDLLNRRLQVAE